MIIFSPIVDIIIGNILFSIQAGLVLTAISFIVCDTWTFIKKRYSLELAPRYGNINALDKLVKQHGIEALDEAKYFDYKYGFLEACHYNQINVVKYYIEKGANINICNILNNQNGLIIACEKDYNVLVKILINTKEFIDLNHECNKKKTALMYACQKENLPMVKEFLKQPNIKISNEKFIHEKINLLLDEYKTNRNKTRYSLMLEEIMPTYYDIVFLCENKLHVLEV